MKILRATLILAVTALNLNLAHADVPPRGRTSGNGAAEEIAAQVNITRDAIDQLMRQMDSRQAGEGFNARDYHALATGFRKDVGDSVARFENIVKESTLKKLALWMERYNSVYLSKDYSAEQKDILLTQLRAQLNGQVTIISGEYQAAIRDVYRALGAFPYGYTWRTYNCSDRDNRSFCKGLGWSKSKAKEAPNGLAAICVRPRWIDGSSGDQKCAVVDHSYSDNTGTSEDASYFRSSLGYAPLLGRMFQEEVLPRLRSGCRSQICIGLKAGDLVFYLGLVKSGIDRQIRVSLADGSTVEVQPVDMNLGTATQLLSDVRYTAAVKALPFDTE